MSEILVDGSFESGDASYGSGPPNYNNPWFVGGTFVPGNPYWDFSTANPRTGSTHMRNNPGRGAGFQSITALTPAASNAPAPSNNYMTAGMNGGDEVDFSLWIRSDGDTVNNLTMRISMWNLEGSFLLSETNVIILSSSYSRWSLRAVAPADGWFQVGISLNVSSQDSIVDTDDWSVIVTPFKEPITVYSDILRTGFRFPHPRWSRRSTATNLLFLETQLEKYIHSHEPAPEEDGGQHL